MAKTKTIYPLKGIFESFLDDAEKKCFLIPTYQRGYKWSSNGGNSQVELLMRDLYSAFETKRERYYLQFLTLKEGDDYFEVIDGQQRLTTITIIFSVYFNAFLGSKENSFVKEKLKFQIREDFINEYIYNNLEDVIKADNWDSFINEHPMHNNQDVFFIFEATKYIYKFFEGIKEKSTIELFYSYICEKVFLIVNTLKSDTKSEKVFINVNKGVKLLDEDLVKGLLITRIPLDNKELTTYRMTEHEVNEIRANIGRQWDELVHWASKPEIRMFFKLGSVANKIGWIIKLTYPHDDGTDLTPMFNFIDNLHRVEKTSAHEIFSKIRQTMLILNDWYCEPEISNLLGYLLHTNKRTSIFGIWNNLKNFNTKKEILTELKKQVKELLPVKDDYSLKELNYVDSKDELHNLFLILDVAKFLPIGNRLPQNYDFSIYSSEVWSIEHIFPQNPGDFTELKFLAEDDLKIIKEILPKKKEYLIIDIDERRDESEILYKKIMASKKECIIEGNELDVLNYLIDKNAPDIHRVGNLALLEKKMNSGLSNHFFEGKRKIIVNKVSTGMFVPFHTYDVFSKLVINSTTSLHVWSKQDIIHHEHYISEQVKQIAAYLS